MIVVARGIPPRMCHTKADPIRLNGTARKLICG
jgi:hypothetical protein